MNRFHATRRRRTVAVVALIAALTVGVASPSASQTVAPPEPSDSGSVLKARYDEVLGAEVELVTRIDAAAKRRLALAVEIDDLNGKISTTGRQLRRADARLDKARTADDRARSALAAARRRLARATDELHAQAVASYIYGGAEDTISAVVEALGNARSAGRTLSYADAVLDHQRDVITEFKAARAQSDRLSRVAASARLDATEARDDIAEVRSALAGAKLRTQVLADRVDRAYLVEQLTLNELRAKKLEIEARIISLEKESDGIAIILAGLQLSQPPYVPGSILFANPIPGAKVGSPFGMRFHPILHYTRLHSGADVSAGSGTPIRAAADGVVVIAGSRGGYGNCTVIDHGSGLATVYAHQSTIGVQEGQTVKLGDVIGQVGSTGLSTGPHLHFEARLRGIPVNPTNFISF